MRSIGTPNKQIRYDNLMDCYGRHLPGGNYIQMKKISNEVA